MVDQLCDGRVALIKIDVEGLEAAVVRGAAGVIDRDAPAVIFEYAPQLLDDADGRRRSAWLAERGTRCSAPGVPGTA